MEDMIAVSASGTHTVGLTAEGTVVSVGSNFKGETNVGDWKDIVSVTAWDSSTVGVKEDGTIAVAGDNFVGTTKEDIMGWTNIKSVAMSTGGSHTVGLKKDGTVVGVGNNYVGQINVGEWKGIQSIAAGSDFTIGLKKDGTVIGTGNKNINVSDWKDIVAITADFGTAVGIKKDGTVVSTDKNFFGESNGEWKDIVAISTKYGHTVGLKSDGTVVATGDNRLGQNNVNEWRDIVALSAGNSSTIGIKNDGTLVVAGLNPSLVPLNYYPSAPVESFDVTKKITKTGDSLKITANFSKAMKNGIQLTFRGAIPNQSVTMEEVPGSNGKSYQYVFTVPPALSGGVNFKLSNLVDANDQPYNHYYANNLVEADNENPIITGAVDTTLFINSVFDPRMGVTATDHFIGDLTNAIKIIGTVDTTKKGVYTLLYSVMDQAGNTTTFSRNITIVDNIKPVISGATSKTIYVNTTFDPRVCVTAMDNSDGDVTSAIKINGLVNSKTAGVYTLTYTVTDSSGNETTVTRQITVTLASPENLKAVASTYNSVSLSWSAVSGASGYEIYRSTSSTGTYTKIASTSSTSYSSTSLNTGTAYYYKIRAYQTVTPSAYSGYSSVVSAKPVLATPSSAKAASSAYNSIKTSWTAVSGASGYEVYRATSSTGSYYYAGSTTSTSFKNLGLVTNKPYYYKIRAYRMVGSTKVYSNLSAVVYAKPIPSVPANFKAAKVSSTRFKLTWSAVAGASGYELYRSTSSSGTYTLRKSTTSLYFTNSGLTKGRTYYYKLRAYRMVGKTKVYSGWTSIIRVKP
nr:immunoglobulin-like domain-containing protein [Bacillus sp. sid0103]